MVKKDWSTRRVFITGATGLLGSALTRTLLEKRATVIALVQEADPKSPFVQEKMIDRVKVVRGNLEDFAASEDAITKYKPDTVFHLGAQTLVGEANLRPLATFEANIRGSYNVLEACRLHVDIVKRIVCASSDKAYGESVELPYTEQMPLSGSNPYDVSKSCMDLLSQSYARTYDTPVCIARCGNIYGPGDLHWSRIVPGTILSLLKNERPIIRSDGKFTRDYLYVEDVAEAYVRIAEEMYRKEIVGQAFNFGPMHPVSVLDLVEMIARLMNKNNLQPSIKNIATHEIRHQYLSSSKAEKLLNWRPKFTLEQGLLKTISWYSELSTQIDHA